MFNPTAYENSRPDGVSVLEIIDETERGEEQPRRFVPLQRTELRGEITGPLAALRLSQVYRFSSAQCDQVLEAVYRFPLPGDAAVTGVRVRFAASIGFASPRRSGGRRAETGPCHWRYAVQYIAGCVSGHALPVDR